MGPQARTSLKQKRRTSGIRSSKPLPVSSSPSQLLRLTLAGVALIALMLVAYGNSTGNGFVWDDHQQILLNPSVKPGAPLSPIFTSDVRFPAHTQSLQGSDYRPLQMLAYRLLFAAFGPDAAAFHICSLVLAIASVLAAFAVFWCLTRRWFLAAAAAALFALHPVHTEAIDWIAALPDLGFSLFSLLSFLCFLLARNAPSAPAPRTRTTWLFTALSWFTFATALLWKETAVIFPLLIALYVLLVERAPTPRPRAALQQSAPYWALLAGYLALRAYILGTLTAGLRDWALSPFQYLLNALYLMVSYWAKLVLPIHLNAYVSFSPIRSISDPRALIAVLVTLAAAAGLFILLRRRPPPIPPPNSTPPRLDLSLALFAALWIVITLLPAMNISALGRNPFAERYLYLPSAGFCLLLALLTAWALDRIPARLQRATAPVLLTLVLAAYMAETIARNPVWKDDATLFSATLELSPDAPFVRNMVALAQSSGPSPSDNSQISAAEQNYLRAIALATQLTPPDRLDAVVAYRGLASIYADRAQYQKALDTLAQATIIDPDNADTDGQKGMILARSGNARAAEPLLRHALAEEPNNENVLAALGLVARDDLHRPAEALAFFEKALAVHPADDDFAASQHNNLGAVYGDTGNLPAATEQFREAVRILPADPEFHTNLANVLAAQGNLAEARIEAQTALRIAPQDPAARELLKDLDSPKN